MSCGGENFIVPGANPCASGGNSIAGVESLNGQAGTVDIIPGDSSIVVTSGGGQVTLTANIGGNVVNTLNYMIGDIIVESTDNSINVVEDVLTKRLDLTTNFPSVVTSFNTINGPVVLTPADGSISVVTDVGAKIVALSANFPPTLSTVTSLNTINGNMTLTSANNSLLITGNTLTRNIDLTVPPCVASINGLRGQTTIQSGNGSINISLNPTTSTMNLAVAPINVGVTSINGEAGPMNIVGTGNTTVTTTLSTITINTPVSGVSQIIAGSNINLDPVGGTGAVTIETDYSGILSEPAPNVFLSGSIYNPTLKFGYGRTCMGSYTITAPDEGIPAGTTSIFTLYNDDAMRIALNGIFAYDVAKTGYVYITLNITMRTIIQSNTNPAGSIECSLRVQGQPEPALPDAVLIPVKANYGAGQYCEMNLNSIVVKISDLLVGWNPASPNQLTLYLNNTLTTPVYWNSFTNKAFGYVQNYLQQ